MDVYEPSTYMICHVTQIFTAPFRVCLSQAPFPPTSSFSVLLNHNDRLSSLATQHWQLLLALVASDCGQDTQYEFHDRHGLGNGKGLFSLSPFL